MKIQCPYCDSYFEDTENNCPNCGANNVAAGNSRFANGQPKTLEELKQWAKQTGLPLDKMHVHIGENYFGPKAFGIYKENNDFIVYKNKSDGTRSIRYQGSDEAYAVNELYQKTKEMTSQHAGEVAKKSQSKYKPEGKVYSTSEIRRRTNDYKNGRNPNKRNKKKKGPSFLVIIVVYIIIIELLVGGIAGSKLAGELFRNITNSDVWSGYDYNYDYNYNNNYNYYNHDYDYDYDYDNDYDYDDYNYNYDSGSNYDSDDWDYDWDSNWDSDWDSDYDSWDSDWDWDSDW